MKNLTVMTFITAPMALIAGLFQMNVLGAPFSQSPHGFWIVLSGMAVIVACLIVYFKLKRWF